MLLCHIKNTSQFFPQAQKPNFAYNHHSVRPSCHAAALAGVRDPSCRCICKKIATVLSSCV